MRQAAAWRSGRAVEEELRVGDVPVAVAAQRRLEVADAHVVGGDGEVVAAVEAARARSRGSAGPLERLGRVEALVDRRRRACRRAAVRGGTPRSRRRVRRVLAATSTSQPQQAAARLGQDLRQADRAPKVVRGPGVGAPGGLEQDERLERRRVDVVAGGHAVDERPPAGGAPGGRGRAARALRVEDVAQPGGGARRERRPAGRRVRERLQAGGAQLPRDGRRGRRVAAAPGQQPGHERAQREERQGQAALPGGAREGRGGGGHRPQRSRSAARRRRGATRR